MLLVASVALCWRRSHPVWVVVVVVSTLSAFEVAYSSPEGLGPLLPLAVALYAAGRYAGPVGFGSAAALTLAAVVVHEVRDPGFVLDGQAAMAWGVIAAAGMVGQSLALADARVDRLRHEAAAGRQEAETARSQAVAAERARIARDLHDLVGHGLSLVVLQLTALGAERQGVSANGERDRLATVTELARGTLAEMRRLVSAAGPDQEPAPLAPQPRLADLPALVADVRGCGFPVALALDDDLRDLPAGVEVALFRVTQEALTNVVRHATGGAEVEVSVHRCDGAVSVRVRNDGARPDAPVRAGRGITGMQERVALYDGTLVVGPDQGGGFVVEARIPVASP